MSENSALFAAAITFPLSGGASSFRDRLFSKLIIDTESGCLLWCGGKRHGYGRITVGGVDRAVHRVVYEMFAGPVPDGLQLDHLCRVRHCANVAHLEPVTGRENTLRGAGVAAACAAKTHCDHGHEFTQANTYIRPTTGRACRACRATATARWRQRKGAA